MPVASRTCQLQGLLCDQRGRTQPGPRHLASEWRVHDITWALTAQRCSHAHPHPEAHITKPTSRGAHHKAHITWRSSRGAHHLALTTRRTSRGTRHPHTHEEAHKACGQHKLPGAAMACTQ